MKCSAFLIAAFLFIDTIHGQRPLNPDEVLSGAVQIKSVKTGNVIGVETVGNGANVYAKDKLAYDKWEVQPNTNLSDPFYFIVLVNYTYKWDHRFGCGDSDQDIITYEKGEAVNNKFYYDPKTQLITVCDGHCVYVDSTNNTLRATKDCSREEDRYFDVTPLSQPTPTPSVDPTPTPSVEPVTKPTLTPEEILSGQVQIKSVKTGNIIGVETIGNGANVYAKDKLAYDTWEVQPNTDITDPFYFIVLVNYTYKWDHRFGCGDSDQDIITYEKGEAVNNKFYYDPKTQLITVCDGHCVYVDSTNNTLRATKDCSREEDRYFDVTPLSQPTPTPSVDPTPTPSVEPVTKPTLTPEEILSGQVQIKSVKTGNIIGVETIGNGANVYAKDKLAYDTWEVQPNTDITDPFYFIVLVNYTYKWDHRFGCGDSDQDIITYEKGEAVNNKFYYDPKTQLITVCDGHCVYVDSTNNTLRATKDCSREEDRYFYVTPLTQPTPTPSVDPTPTPSVDPTPTPSVDPTPTPSVDPTPTPSVDPTPTPSVDPTPTPSVDPTPTPSVDPTPTPSVDPTPTPSVDPTPTPSVDPTPTPSVDPTPTPSVDPTPTPSVDPTPTPSVDPTPTPSVDPTPTPSVDPTPTPSVDPTPTPSVDPTPTPSVDPTPTPSVDPTPTPSVDPTPTPSVDPTPTPSVGPTPTPSVGPTPTPSGSCQISPWDSNRPLISALRTVWTSLVCFLKRFCSLS